MRMWWIVARGGTDGTAQCCFLPPHLPPLPPPTDFATVACLRVLLTWLADCPDAGLAFVEDKSAFLFVTQSAVSNEESVHVQALCAMVLGVPIAHGWLLPPR